MGNRPRSVPASFWWTVFGGMLFGFGGLTTVAGTMWRVDKVVSFCFPDAAWKAERIVLDQINYVLVTLWVGGATALVGAIVFGTSAFLLWRRLQC